MHTWLYLGDKIPTKKKNWIDIYYTICIVCYILHIKGTVRVLSSDLPCKETVFDQYCGSFCCFLCLEVVLIIFFIFFNVRLVKVTLKENPQFENV